MAYFLMGFFMLAAFLYAGIGSLDFQVGARIFPLVIVAIGVPVTALALWQEYRAQQRARAALAGAEGAARAQGTADNDAPDDAPTRQVMPHYAHIALFLAMLLTLGFPLAAGLYTFAFITLSTWKLDRNRALIQGAALGLLAYAMGIGFRLISAGNLQ